MANARGESVRVAVAETRSDPRVGVELRAEVVSDQFSGSLPAVTRDLSVGGACIATRSPIAASSLHHVVLHLPAGPVRVPAAGRWQVVHAPTGAVLTGVKFVGLSAEQQDLIWDHVLEVTKDLARFLLRKSDLRDVGIDGAMSLAQASRLCIVGAGSAVFQQGGGDGERPQNSFFVLREGSVLLRTRLRGAIERDIATVQPGELLGGLPMFAAAGHAESAVARSQSRLIEIDERAYLYLMQARPWVAQKLAFAAAQTYARRLHATLESLSAAR